MKKKGFVVLAVAAVLALGTATMSAWAAEGLSLIHIWQQQMSFRSSSRRLQR